MYQETIDLSHLPPEGLTLDRRIHSNAWKIQENDWQSTGDLVFNLHLTGDVRKTTVAGRLTAQILGECNRCLKAVEVPIERKFELTYMPVDPARLAKEEVELDPMELGVAYMEKMFLPLHELIREQVYLSVPMKVLCRPDCAGLCPHCGADLNEVECGCSSEAVDPRWASLKTISSKPN
ncbi:MAG TPA: DUF177 domain-containing protein [Acidobacteriota bacterium]|nr:DUF177 domain-containing protein [Acidobacteriota bacterium]